MARRKNTTTFPWFVLLLIVFMGWQANGAALTVLAVIGIVAVFIWIGNVYRAADRRPGSQSLDDRFVAPQDPADLPPEAVERLRRLAGEMVVPGGRSTDEVMREAAEVYAQLPPHVREQLDRAAPDHGPGVHVEVSGPLGDVLARVMGFEPAPTRTAPPSAPVTPHAPAAAPTAGPTAEPAAAAEPAAEPAPTAPPAPAPAAAAAAATAPAPITPAPITLAPITLAPITPSAPVTRSAPAAAPAAAAADRPDQDVRSGTTAPDELTGAETEPPGTLAEGWYVTADGGRERWWNGASWTAHVRSRGAQY